VRQYPGKKAQNKDGDYCWYPCFCKHFSHSRPHQGRKTPGRSDENPVGRKQKSKKTGCPMKIKICAVDKLNPAGAWYIKDLDRNVHNHPADDPASLAGLRRTTHTPELLAFIKHEAEAGKGVAAIYSTIQETEGFKDIMLTSHDLKNYITKFKAEGGFFYKPQPQVEAAPRPPRPYIPGMGRPPASMITAPAPPSVPVPNEPNATAILQQLQAVIQSQHEQQQEAMQMQREQAQIIQQLLRAQQELLQQIRRPQQVQVQQQPQYAPAYNTQGYGQPTMQQLHGMHPQP